MTEAEKAASYPATLSIDYPDRPLNRLTTFFRIFTVIPIAIILALLTGSMSDDWSFAYAGIAFLPLILMLLFRKKYPRWWFDWNLNLTKFSTRVTSYMSLLDDVYPSTDDEQSVHIEIAYPDAQHELSRGLPLVKWLLAFPHYIVLACLGLGVLFCIIIAFVHFF